MPDPSPSESPSSSVTASPYFLVAMIVGGAVLLGVLIASFFLFRLAKQGRPLGLCAIDEAAVVRATALQELSPQFSIRTEAESLTRRRLFDGTMLLEYTYDVPAPQTMLIHSELQLLTETCESKMDAMIRRAEEMLTRKFPDARIRPMDQIVAWTTDTYWFAESFRDLGDGEQTTGYAFIGCDRDRLYSVFMTSDELGFGAHDVFVRAVNESIQQQRNYAD